MDVENNIVFYVDVKYLVHNILRKNVSDIHLFKSRQYIHLSFEIVLFMYIFILL